MWFKRERKLKSIEKKDIPDGLWLKCKQCNEILYKAELQKNFGVCENCGYHFKIPAKRYIEILTEASSQDNYKEININIESTNPLLFNGYTEKLSASQKKTQLKEAVITSEVRIGKHRTALGVMDFSFMGGSMGSVVGEKVKKLIYYALDKKMPLIIISASGGARMQEGILSLMQMAKTGAALAELRETKIPYISVLTNPTTAGVMASYASLGDITIAEPKALIGFAGPRVIQQTINQELPEGFQTAEFLLEHGLLDAVVPRDKLKQTLIEILDFFRDK